MRFLVVFFTSLIFLMGSCNNNESSVLIEEEAVTSESPTEAKITSVSVSGESLNYTFNVGVVSPDTGCEQYADWWEVISEEGELMYRRILTHSHVTEQPFLRSGSGISVDENQILIIRAHMNNLGYGTQVYKGSISTGFNESNTEGSFASDLVLQNPLPESCAF